MLMGKMKVIIAGVRRRVRRLAGAKDRRLEDLVSQRRLLVVLEECRRSRGMGMMVRMTTDIMAQHPPDARWINPKLRTTKANELSSPPIGSTAQQQQTRSPPANPYPPPSGSGPSTAYRRASSTPNLPKAHPAPRRVLRRLPNAFRRL